MSGKKNGNRDRARQMLADGFKVREIARALNLTTQRIYQFKKELVEEEAKR